MKDADDRKDNMLVIDENGYPKIIQDITDGILYPVSLESWDSRNGYVGKYSNLLSLNESYIQALQGWLFYLKKGRHIRIDYLHENKDEEQLKNEIKKYY